MFIRVVFLLILVGISFVSGGCISFLGKEKEVLSLQELSEPAEASVAAAVVSGSDKQVVLRPGLVLKVVVFVAGDVEISEICRISYGGYISIPLVGKVVAQGMTIGELSESLEANYGKNYFVNPTVYISYETKGVKGVSPWGFVTVLGRVKKPGRVSMPATHDLSLTLALQQAGGFSSSAKQSAIRISRLNSDGEREKIKVNLDRVGAKGKGEEDIDLQAGDVIYVPETIF